MLFRLKSLHFFAQVAKLWPVITLLAISILLCILNYTPGTYLSGWDTLHPEFNFGLNIERTLNGVFRIEQGLGAVASHSHIADLPRIIILFIADLLLPTSFLRYFYIDLCIILGSLGMYFFLKRHFLKQRTIAFLGAIFYLLNLGTVQTFNVPFEMFTTLFAALPFIFLFATSFLNEKANSLKNLLLFAFVIVLASPAAYAATLWYIFFLCFTLYFLIYALISNKNDKQSLIKFIILIAITISINLYWIIPNIYFVLTHAAEVSKANINLLFSDQAFLKNKEFGNLRDILFLKTFYFDWKIYASNNQFVDLLLAFISHLKSPLVLLTGYLFSFGIVAGGVYYAIKLKLKSLPLFAVILLSLLFLFNDNLPFSPIFNLFQNHVPFFKEALRFPGDKILNVFVFFVTILFSYSLILILEGFKKIHQKIQPEIILTPIVFILLIFYSLPSFGGNFINPLMRVKIPDQYFKLFDYLNSKPQSLRVANLPVHSPWGWVYYDWKDIRTGPSFQGAGFLYFGIKQPLLDRDFDRWNPYNESYYREISYAIYKQDAQNLKNVLNKYKIGYIFIDKSVINPQSSSLPLYFRQSENLLEKTGLIKEKHSFNTISLYKLASGTNFLSTVDTKINASPTTTTTNYDFAYSQFGDYITYPNLPQLNKVSYPFRDLINNQAKLHTDIVSEDSNNIILSPKITSSSFQTELIADSIKTIITDLIVNLNSNLLTITFKPNLPILNTLPLSTPQTQKLPLTTDSNNLYLSINAKDLISLKNLQKDTPILVGKTELENGANTISVFDTDKLIPITNTKQRISPFFSSCSDTDAPPTAGILTNGLSLTGKGDLCILIPFVFLPQIDTSTVLSQFSFNLEGASEVTSCLYDIVKTSCIYYKNPVISGSKVSFDFPFYNQDKQKLAIKIFIKPNNLKLNTYSLTEINSSYAKSIANLNLTKDFIAKMFSSKTQIGFDKLVFPKNNIYKPETEITKTHLINDCKAANAKKEIVTDNSEKMIKYVSIEGSFCDYFSYPNLTHDQGYLISVSSKNQSGLPLTLCISNYTTRKCDIYANLGSFKILNKDYFMLPPTDENGIGYDLNFENLGIKGTTSINYLASVQIMPIPYEFIGNIKTQSLATQKTNYNGKIINAESYQPNMHVVQISKPAILRLNQSFEKGFTAYSINCNFGLSCRLKGLLAPLIGTQIKDHVLINNWANGWIIDSSKLKAQNSKIVILFLPQYLEFIGFTVLISIFMLLLLPLKGMIHR